MGLRRFLAAASLVASSAGCITAGPAFSPAPDPAPDKALVYFLRGHIPQGGLFPTTFTVNDVEVVTLGDWGYSWIYLDPGTYEFEAVRPMRAQLRFRLEVNRGRKYFLEFNQRGAGPRTVRETFRAMDEASAIALMKDFRFSEPKSASPRIPQDAVRKPQAPRP